MKCKQCTKDLYWQKMSKIMTYWYSAIVGICIPLVLLGSISYIIPGIVYCKNFQYLTDQPFQNVTNISIGFGITSTVQLSTDEQPEYKRFLATCEDKAGQLKCTKQRSTYTCSNIQIKSKITNEQNLSIECDTMSPLNLGINMGNLTSLNVNASNFAGNVLINNSQINNVNIITKSPVLLSNLTEIDQLMITQSSKLEIINSFVKHQYIKTGGTYKYVQISNNSINLLNITTYNANIIGKEMLFCIPAKTFEGHCAQLQNKYISGQIGIYLFENNQLVAEISSKQNGNQDLKAFLRGEIVQGCYKYTNDVFTNNITIQAFNRGAVILILYTGNLPQRCKE